MALSGAGLIGTPLVNDLRPAPPRNQAAQGKPHAGKKVGELEQGQAAIYRFAAAQIAGLKRLQCVSRMHQWFRGAMNSSRMAGLVMR
jgi:hypothetical protein